MEKNLKPQKEVERFMIKPHYGLFLGVIVNKNTDIEDETDDGKVHQIIKGTTFTTIKKEEKEKDGIKIAENSKLIVEVPEGTRLIWVEGQGYILPDFELKTTKEVIEDMECIKEF
ncbi:MAG: hypothetical protein HFJ49_03265 [Clostridia bacterium]|jgi:hypothetical protein|nr:hypothetical protein [Clostridia bacterium]